MNVLLKMHTVFIKNESAVAGRQEKRNYLYCGKNKL